MTRPKAAAFRGAPSRPRSWDKAVGAAYIRALGGTQAEAAGAAGIAARTLRGWESAPWWPEAQREAESRFLAGLTAAARRAVLQTVEAGNAVLGFQVLERLLPELAPPRVRATIGTFDYGKLSDEQLERIAAGEDPGNVVGR